MQPSPEIPTVQKVIAVMWPSFLTSGLATILLFTAFDPQLIFSVSGYGEISRLGGYTTGFFLFWLLTASTCAMTCYFQKPCQPENNHPSASTDAGTHPSSSS